MPLFYFDTDDGKTKFHDDVGTELPDKEAARDEASRALAELALDYIPSGEPQANLTMWVRNVDGTPLLQLALSFAVTQGTTAAPASSGDSARGPRLAPRHPG